MEQTTPTIDDVSTGKVEEFIIGDRVLVYDFDALTLGQMKIAEAIYEFAADLEKNPPRTQEEKIRLSADRDARTLATILIERDKTSGSLLPFTFTEAQKLPLLSVVNNLPAKDVKRAEECIRDFFAQRGRTTLFLMVRSAFEIKYAEVALEGLARKVAMIQGQISSVNSQKETSESADSKNGEPSTNESESASETPISGQ